MTSSTKISGETIRLNLIITVKGDKGDEVNIHREQIQSLENEERIRLNFVLT
jgi:hypothetical protein